MKILLSIFAILILCYGANPSQAREVDFPVHQFSLEIPADWNYEILEDGVRIYHRDDSSQFLIINYGGRDQRRVQKLSEEISLYYQWMNELWISEVDPWALNPQEDDNIYYFFFEQDNNNGYGLMYLDEESFLLFGINTDHPDLDIILESYQSY